LTDHTVRGGKKEVYCELTENLHLSSQAASIGKQGWCSVALLQQLQGMSPLVGSNCHPEVPNSPTHLLTDLMFSGISGAC
jgi:hypothetical protein